MTDSRIDYLLDKYFAKTCTPSEKEELAAYILDQRHKGQLEKRLSALWDTFATDEKLSETDSKRIYDELLVEVRAAKLKPVVYNAGKKAPLRRLWPAAAFAGLIGIGTALFYQTQQKSAPAVGTSARLQTDSVAQPVHGGVTLAMTNGEQLSIDKMQEGSHVTHSGLGLKKTAGDALSLYKPASAETGRGLNTLRTGSGKSYKVTLTDGTTVWLNASSSITFPAAFAQSERKVAIEGEAYFEVTADARRPFRITARNQVVEVLGTTFNINAYSEQGLIQSTLVQGKIKVGTAGSSLVLKPGQQTNVMADGSIGLANVPDVEAATAWTRNYFQFRGASIEMIMSHLSKWYGVPAEIKDRIDEKFVLEISRNAPLDEVLTLLKLTGQLDIKETNGVIYVAKK